MPFRAVLLVIFAANLAQAADPCLIPGGRGFLPTLTLDPDARSSRVLDPRRGEDFAFEREVESSCQRIRVQARMLIHALPPSCAAYTDLTGVLTHPYDPRRCLSSAAFMNFRREVRLLLQARDADGVRSDRTYVTHTHKTTLALLKLADESCGPHRVMPLAERAACWERKAHGLMDRAKRAWESTQNGNGTGSGHGNGSGSGGGNGHGSGSGGDGRGGDRDAAAAGFCTALSAFSPREKEVLALMAASPGVGSSCRLKTAPDLSRCEALSANAQGCVENALRAMGEDWRRGGKHLDPGNPHYLGDRFAAIASQATKLSLFGRICTTNLRFDALTKSASELAPLMDDVTRRRCRVDDIRRLQEMTPEDWARFLEDEKARLASESDPFDKDYDMPELPEPELSPEPRPAPAPSDNLAACPDGKAGADPTGAQKSLGSITTLPIHVDLSEAAPDPSAPAAKPNSKPAPKPAKPTHPRTPSETGGSGSGAENQDIAMLLRLGFHLPKAVDPKDPPMVPPSGPAKTRNIRELAREADKELSAFNAAGKPSGWKSGAFWLEAETEGKLARAKPGAKDGEDAAPPSAARYFGWQASASEAIAKARDRVAALPKNATYEQRVRAVIESLHEDYLKFYDSSHGDVTDYFENGYANITAQTRFTLMTLGELGLLSATPNGKRGTTQRVLVYRTAEGGAAQLHVALFDPKTREVVDPFTNTRSTGTEIPLYEPELMVRDYLTKESARSGVTPLVGEQALLVPGTEPPPPPPATPEPKPMSVAAATSVDPSPSPTPKPAGKPDPQVHHLTEDELRKMNMMMMAINWDIPKSDPKPFAVKPGPKPKPKPLSAEDSKKLDAAIDQALKVANTPQGKAAIDAAMKGLTKEAARGNGKGASTSLWDLIKALGMIGKLPANLPVGKLLGELVKHPELMKYAPDLIRLGMTAAGDGPGIGPVIGQIELPKDGEASQGLLSKILSGIGSGVISLGEGIGDVGKAIGHGIAGIGSGIAGGVGSIFGSGGQLPAWQLPVYPNEREVNYWEDKTGLLLSADLVGNKEPSPADIQKEVKRLGGWVQVRAYAGSDGQMPPRWLELGIHDVPGYFHGYLDFADPKDRAAFAKLTTEKDRERFVLGLKLRDIQEKLGKIPVDKVAALFKDPVVLARMNGQNIMTEDERKALDELPGELTELMRIAPQEGGAWLKDTVSKLPAMRTLLDPAHDFALRTRDHPEEWANWVKMMGRTPGAQGLDLDRSERLLESLSGLEEELLKLRQTVDFNPAEWGAQHIDPALRAWKSGDKLDTVNTPRLDDLILDGIRADRDAIWRLDRPGQQRRDYVKPRVGLDARNAAAESLAQPAQDPGAQSIFGEPAWEGNAPPPPAAAEEGPSQPVGAGQRPSVREPGSLARAPVIEKRKVEGDPPSQAWKPPKADERYWPARSVVRLLDRWLDRHPQVPDGSYEIRSFADSWNGWLSRHGSAEFLRDYWQDWRIGAPKIRRLAMVLRNYRAIADSRGLAPVTVGGATAPVIHGPDGKPIPADLALVLLQALDEVGNLRYQNQPESPAGPAQWAEGAEPWFTEIFDGTPGFPRSPAQFGSPEYRDHKLIEYRQWALEYQKRLRSELEGALIFAQSFLKLDEQHRGQSNARFERDLEYIFLASRYGGTPEAVRYLLGESPPRH